MLSDIYFKDCTYLFLEKGREGEKHQCVRELYAPNQGPGPQPGMCPDWELNR